jgi:hypothetical protein
LWRLDPCIIELGPTKTLSPIFVAREICTLSWIILLFPILIGEEPIIVAPYQTEEFCPIITSPKMVALGATN